MFPSFSLCQLDNLNRNALQYLADAQEASRPHATNASMHVGPAHRNAIVALRVLTESGENHG